MSRRQKEVHQVQVGSSPLNLCVMPGRKTLLAHVTTTTGKTIGFWVKPKDLQRALEQLAPRKQRKHPQPTPAPSDGKLLNPRAV